MLNDSDLLPKVRALLRHRGRVDLADLLVNAILHFGVDDHKARPKDLFDSATARVIVPVDAYERLRALSPADHRTLLFNIYEVRQHSGGPVTAFLHFVLDTDSLREEGQLPDFEMTGWALVDRQVMELRRRVAEAETEEQCQMVGLLCRETLISLAQVVFDPAQHPSLDGVQPSDSDSKRMLDAYVATELQGSSQEAARRHAKAALAFANELTHHRTATFREAAMCAEATSSVVNQIAIISGRRDPK